MSKVGLHALGTNDGWASNSRGHSAFLFRMGNNMLLMDCGEPVSRSLRAAGVQPDDLDGILLSHLHCDHVGGFFMLVQGFWLDQRTRDLTVHMPQEGLKPVRRMLDASYIFEELLAFNLDFKEISTGDTFHVGDIRITSYPTTHLAQLRESFTEKYPAKFEAFCFLMETDNATVGHSADIGALKDLEPLLQKPVDLLVCELAHVKPDELFTFLSNKKIGHVAFTHISRPYRESLDELKRKAKTALGGMPHTFLMDGDLIEV
jgi:ribonuclease Z|tara:strand:+ start:1075 stop:1857 length:783 start_codon:yes stop_codon:yes gene_type:complete